MPDPKSGFVTPDRYHPNTLVAVEKLPKTVLDDLPCANVDEERRILLQGILDEPCSLLDIGPIT